MSKYPSIIITIDEIEMEVWYCLSGSKESVTIHDIKTTDQKVSAEDWAWATSQIWLIEQKILAENAPREQDFDDIGD